MTERVEFWRVENVHQEGPYNCERTPKPLRGTVNWARHPYPTDDGLNFRHASLRQHFFGFRSEQQLREWFDGLLPILGNAPEGWYIVKYMVDARLVHHGGQQSIVLKAEIETGFPEMKQLIKEYLLIPYFPDIPVGTPLLEDLPDPIRPGADDF